MLCQFEVNGTGSGKVSRLMHLYLPFWLLLAGLTCFAQNQFEPLPLPREDHPENYLLPVQDSSNFWAASQAKSFHIPYVDNMPAFKGGLKGLSKHLNGNLKYPPDAIAHRITGTVFIGFTVQADGSVADARVLKGIGYGCDEEALRAVREMPAWEPATLSGKPKAFPYYSLPIRFQYADPEKPCKRGLRLPFRRTFSR